jgi:hypothetical protein
VSDFEKRLTAGLHAAVEEAQPPARLMELIRQRHRRHRIRVSVTGAAVIAVIGLAVPVAVPALSGGGGPAAPAGSRAPSSSLSAGPQPGTVLQNCTDQIAGGFSTNWKRKSIHVGPLWFVDALPLQAGRDGTSPLPFGNLPVNEMDNNYAWVKVVGPARDYFRFLANTDFKADGSYTLSDGQPGVTFAACPDGRELGTYYRRVTQFWLGFVIAKVPACVTLDLWTRTSKRPARLTLAVNAISGGSHPSNASCS